MLVLRWIWQNKGSLILAVILSLTVWVAAVTAEDPTVEKPFDEPIPLNYLAPQEGLTIVGNAPREAQVTIRAPQSVWDQMALENIDLTVDLSTLESGTYEITLQPTINLRPAQIIAVDPPTITLQLESVLSRRVSIEINLIGEPALGFDVGQPLTDIEEATINGPESAVTAIARLIADFDLEGAREDVEQVVPLQPVDQDGNLITGVTMSPASIQILVPVEQGDRYRLVSVIPKIEGTPEYGYRITSIQVIPDQVIVTSTDPKAFDTLAGFVETDPIDLTGVRETIERRAALDLPAEFSLVGSQTVMVKVSITPITNSIALILPVEFQGLGAGLAAEPSPSTVTVFLTGPLAILEELDPEDIHVRLNLMNLEEGVHVVTPEVIIPQVEIKYDSILPETIEVTIGQAPPTTPTPVP